VPSLVILESTDCYTKWLLRWLLPCLDTLVFNTWSRSSPTHPTIKQSYTSESYVWWRLIISRVFVRLAGNYFLECLLWVLKRSTIYIVLVSICMPYVGKVGHNNGSNIILYGKESWRISPKNGCGVVLFNLRTMVRYCTAFFFRVTSNSISHFFGIWDTNRGNPFGGNPVSLR
jgi:hypothetical protein